MDMGIKEWLLIVGVVLIVAVFADGYRRYRRDKNKRLGVKLDKNFIGSENHVDEDIDLLRSELPNGGARVVTPAPTPAQASFDLGEPQIPMLTDNHSEIDAQPVFIDPVDTSEAFPEPEPTQAAPVPPKPAPVPVPPKSAPKPKRKKDQAKAPAQAMLSELIVMYVRSSKDSLYMGEALLQCLVDKGLRHGSKDIFHYFNRQTDADDALFSVANLQEPGTFNVAGMSGQTTPGVALFLQLPGPQDPLAVFDAMLSTAQYIADELGGRIEDEQRSIMTKQTTEHLRQRIREFNRRSLSGA